MSRFGFCTFACAAVLFVTQPICASPNTIELDPPIHTGDVLLKAANPHPVVLQISQFNIPNSNYAIIEPTIKALESAFGKGNLEVVVFRGGVVKPQDADLILTSSGSFRRHYHLGVRDLATLASDSQPNPNHADGSVFAVRRDRSDLQTLSDLKGARLAAVSPVSFSGYQIGARELFLHHLNPDKLFSTRIWTNEMPKALRFVLENKADVAIVRACALEELEAEGFDVSNLRIINQKPASPDLHCAASTALYPNWTFYASARASAETARKGAGAHEYRVWHNLPRGQRCG